jgi:hypothetical protein
MSQNRRNYYRILHLQPDAPAEVVKACYRTLMSTLRHHPDLGGDHETAALINEAYAVLSDATRRTAYDAARAAASTRGMPGGERGGRTAPPPAPAPCAEARPRCPFCRQPVAARHAPGARCSLCKAPLTPVKSPSAADVAGERRSMPRVSKSDWALLHVDIGADGIDVRLRDLSLAGISLYCGLELPLHQRVRVVGQVLDVVADIVSCRRSGSVFIMHARLVTAQFRDRTGVFVSTSA